MARGQQPSSSVFSHAGARSLMWRQRRAMRNFPVAGQDRQRRAQSMQDRLPTTDRALPQKAVEVSLSVGGAGKFPMVIMPAKAQPCVFTTSPMAFSSRRACAMGFIPVTLAHWRRWRKNCFYAERFAQRHRRFRVFAEFCQGLHGLSVPSSILPMSRLSPSTSLKRPP